MWDDAAALRRLANALFGASLVLLLVVGLAGVLRLPAFALRVVQLDAAPQRVDRTHLEEAVRNAARGNFFTVDLVQARRAFERLPWVRAVSVRRHFPWQLDVTIEEHVALARWNGTLLVNPQGEVFAAQDAETLPELFGPDDAAAEVVQYYGRFSQMLAPLGLRVAQLALSPRHAWQLRLEGGMVVRLGREQVEERLARFAAAYPRYLAGMTPQARYVDLRYRNGFAAGAAG